MGKTAMGRIEPRPDIRPTGAAYAAVQANKRFADDYPCYDARHYAVLFDRADRFERKNPGQLDLKGRKLSDRLKVMRHAMWRFDALLPSDRLRDMEKRMREAKRLEKLRPHYVGSYLWNRSLKAWGQLHGVDRSWLRRRLTNAYRSRTQACRQCRGSGDFPAPTRQVCGRCGGSGLRTNQRGPHANAHGSFSGPAPHG